MIVLANRRTLRKNVVRRTVSPPLFDSSDKPILRKIGRGPLSERRVTNRSKSEDIFLTEVLCLYGLAWLLALHSHEENRFSRPAAAALMPPVGNACHRGRAQRARVIVKNCTFSWVSEYTLWQVGVAHRGQPARGWPVWFQMMVQMHMG